MLKGGFLRWSVGGCPAPEVRLGHGGMMAARKKAGQSDENAAVWMAPGDLVPWADNPRHSDHVVDMVRESIRRFGFGAPVVARADGLEIIAGHTRLRAAVAEGLERVPVRLMDISEEEAHLLALADNKIGEAAEWDMLALSEMGSDLDLWDAGFDAVSMEEIDAALAATQRKEKRRDGNEGKKTGKTGPRTRTVTMHIAVDDVATVEDRLGRLSLAGETRGQTLVRILEVMTDVL